MLAATTPEPSRSLGDSRAHARAEIPSTKLPKVVLSNTCAFRVDCALNGEIYFLLVQLSTWKAWRVHAAPDFAVQTDTFAMDDEYFYYGEAPLAKAGLYATLLRRLALKSLDQAPYVTPL